MWAIEYKAIIKCFENRIKRHVEKNINLSRYNNSFSLVIYENLLGA